MSDDWEDDDVDPTRIDIKYDPFTQRMTGVAAHGDTPFDVPFISQIDGNLYQGGCFRGLVLPPIFKHVISLYQWERYTIKHDLDSMLTVKMYDSTDGVDLEQLAALAQWVDTCTKTGPTLVHCQAGLNRSSLVAGATLVSRGTHTGLSALVHLRSVRSPAALCNPTFQQVLLNLQLF